MECKQLSLSNCPTMAKVERFLEFSGALFPEKTDFRDRKKNFQGWIMETKNGEKEIFALIEFESSVAKVLSNPAAFIGKECTVTVDMVEGLLAGRKEPTDLIRIRDVKWTQQSARAPMVSSAAQSPPTSIESIVRSFFVAIEDHDIGTLTHLLDDSVQYYQTRPISRAAVLADIKGDWKRYQNWKARITDFQTDGAFSCTFKLSYTSMEGPRPRSSTLQCTASVNPNKPNGLSKITVTGHFKVYHPRSNQNVPPRDGSFLGLAGCFWQGLVGCF